MHENRTTTDLSLLVHPEQEHQLHGEALLAADVVGRHDEAQALREGDVESGIVQLVDHLLPGQAWNLWNGNGIFDLSECNRGFTLISLQMASLH